MNIKYKDVFSTWVGKESDFHKPDIVLLQAPC